MNLDEFSEWPFSEFFNKMYYFKLLLHFKYCLVGLSITIHANLQDVQVLYLNFNFCKELVTKVVK